MMLRGDGGTGYIRVDWFTPDGLPTWGDGRLTILGTDGFIEIRKNVDIAGRPGGSHLFLSDQKETTYVDTSKVELTYGRQVVSDILDRTETAMTQAHCFLAMQLVLEAQDKAQSPKLDVTAGRIGDPTTDATSAAERRRFLRRPRRRGGDEPRRHGLGFPAIVPSTVLGAQAPSNQITVGAIGVGRISRGHDLPGIWKHPQARIMAVCDLDARRVDDAKVLVNGHYAKTTGKPYDGVTGYADYRELLANRDIDAVVISTPDHWHAAIAIAAARAGKDIYLQKPRR